MTYIIWLATALSIPGLIVMARRREPVILFVAAVLLIYPLAYYFVVTDVRYRYPVLWLSLLPAGYVAHLTMKRLAVVVDWWAACRIDAWLRSEME
jgi:hypothetical protein